MIDRIFATSKRERDRRHGGKDAETCPIIQGIRIRKPEEFHAILMPNCYGPELDILKDKGIPDKNIWAIERERENFNKMKRVLSVRMLNRPMDVSEALDHIWTLQPKNDLIYLDFYSQPNILRHFPALCKIFLLGGGMIKPGGKLILTFGRNRCHPHVRDLNNAMGRLGWRHVPEHWVDLVIEMTGHQGYKGLKIHEYSSFSHSQGLVLKFYITEMDF